jgi:predicted Zn-dependent protease
VEVNTMVSHDHRAHRLSLPLAITLLALGFGGCSVNPATGKRQIALISEQQEIAMGLESAKGAEAQYGRYPDDELQAYVSEIGQRLAAASERPQLPWSFTVIDDPTVNAFALPGGQIFVTRGILTHFNSEAELASVLGHEIGHVTARHSVEQLSTQQLASLGLGVAMIASEDMRPYGGMIAQGMQLMFLKFSRDDESQSDMLGLRYMTRTGYDPNEMPKMFVTLGRISELQGGGRIPAWASTHPDPVNREQDTYDRIAALPPDQRSGMVNREGYLRRLEGVVYGDDPRQGYFVGNAFYHPELEFKLLFPDGWQTMNTRQFVAAVSPEQTAIVQLSLARESSSAAAANAFFEGGSIERGPSWGRSFHQFRTKPSEEQPTVVRGLAGFIEHGELVYRLVGYTTDDRWQDYQRTLEGSLGTFAKVTDRRYLDVTPKTVELVELPRPMTIAQLNRRYPSTIDEESLAIANSVELDTVIPAGTLVKRVVGGQLPDK